MDLTQSSNFPPVEEPSAEVEIVYTEEQKLEKLTAWWKILDELANGNGFTGEDLVLVLDNMKGDMLAKIQHVFVGEVRLAFIQSYNQVRSQFGASFKEKATQEMSLRKEVASMWFPKPKEGTNKAELPGEWGLKYTHKLTRTVNEEVLPAVVQQIRELGVNPDPLTKVEHSVSIKEYRALETLNKEAFKLFETALTIKPGSPVLELVPPKKKETE